MNVNFEKGNGLVPVIVQHDVSMQVLMLGYMNAEAFKKTRMENRVTFYSRSKKRLWTKGESSGNFLEVKNIKLDCDEDAILISALPLGATCHLGRPSCFDQESSKGFIFELEQIIQQQIESNTDFSYTNKLYRSGMNKVAQKVGEEAVELVIEAMGSNDDLFMNEAADLLYHLLILLKAKSMKLTDVESVLKRRRKSKLASLIE